MFKRNYTPQELLGEITNLINSGEYEDFLFIAFGEIRSIRIGSEDKDLRIGDLVYMIEHAKNDIMEE